ncbi:MAG: hypothetical protein AB7T06_21380 [Kofleriaceae bacterium]
MRALVIMLVLGTSGVAHAQMPRSFGSWMHYELSGLHAIDESMTSSTELVLAGARVGGFIGKKRVAYAASFDFAFGSTIGKSGFMYELGLLPIGMALRPSERSVIAFATGIAGTGAVGTLDDAVALPLELTAETTLGPLRLLARARASFLAASDARQDGSPTFGWADEVDATFGIRIGPRYNAWHLASGNGYFLGATYREMEGAKFFGVVIGHSVDMGSQTRSQNAWEMCEDCD